jgi:hypothetical protein
MRCSGAIGFDGFAAGTFPQRSCHPLQFDRGRRLAQCMAERAAAERGSSDGAG